MDSRTTNQTGIAPPKETGMDQWSALFPWDSLTISHALLPVLCAMFITLVIVVIACCLIQKKPKSAGHCRQRRCNTLETSHELSDHGVYDVIDEVNVATLPLRCNEKLNSNLMIGTQLLRHSKMVNIFTNAPCNSLSLAPASSPAPAESCDVKTLNIPEQTSRSQFWRYPESVPPFLGQSCLTNQPESNIACSEKGLEDGRVYETLDRHWTLMNERHKQQLVQPENTTNHLNGNPTHHHANLYDTFECKPKREGHTSDIDCHSFAATDQLCPVLRTTSTSSPHTEPNKILCQLSMFKMCDGTQEKPTLIEKAYYHVQPHRDLQSCSHFEEISAMFQSANLRIVQSDFREAPVNGKGLDLVLKPAKLLGNSIIHLRDKIPNSAIIERAQSSHPVSPTEDIVQPRSTSAKRSLPARAVSSDISYTQNNSSNRQCLENVLAALECSETIQSNRTKSPEAVRISTKLGPLPPLPIQQNVSCEKMKPGLTSVISDSNYLHHKPPTATSSISGLQNHTVPQSFIVTAPSKGHSQQMDIAFCLSRQQVFSPKSNTVTREQVDNGRVKFPQNKMASGNFPNISPGIVYVTDMPNTSGIRTVSYGSDNYNDYFVLEPGGSSSGVNSDNEDTPD